MKTLVLLLSLTTATASFASNDLDGSTRIPHSNVVKTGKRITVVNTRVSGQLQVTSSTEGTIGFFVFDLNGQLAYETQIENKQSKTISGLKKGLYLYTVQLHDQKLEEGKLIIK